MSNKGRYLRGEKWFMINRDKDGNLTEDLKKDADKMLDVNFYLAAQKPEEETKSRKKK